MEERLKAAVVTSAFLFAFDTLALYWYRKGFRYGYDAAKGEFWGGPATDIPAPDERAERP